MMKIFVSKPCPIVINSTPNTETILENVVTNGVQRKVSKIVPFKGNNQNISYKAYSPDKLIAAGEIKPIKTYIGTSVDEQINAISDFNDRLGEALNS